MPFAYTISAVIPASPQAIYDAWLDGKTHAAMTGTSTAKGSSDVGGAIEAWDGYISGRNTALVPGKRIAQAWRTTEFAPSDPDSAIVLTLAKVAGGTKLTLAHSNVPDGHEGYKGGWVKFYFEPMQAYFAAQAPAKTKTKPKAKAKPKPKPAVKARATPAKAAKKPAKKHAVKKQSSKKPVRKKTKR